MIEHLSAEIETVISPFALSVRMLRTIPGVDRRTAEMLIAEIGPDMYRFGSSGRLASWAGLCPGNNESAGKHFSGRTRKGSKWLRSGLTQSAKAASRSKGTYFYAQYGRLKARRGHGRATIAVAHSILVVAYHILDRGRPYEGTRSRLLRTTLRSRTSRIQARPPAQRARVRRQHQATGGRIDVTFTSVRPSRPADHRGEVLNGIEPKWAQIHSQCEIERSAPRPGNRTHAVIAS